MHPVYVASHRSGTLSRHPMQQLRCSSTLELEIVAELVDGDVLLLCRRHIVGVGEWHPEIRHGKDSVGVLECGR
jgi:hypothetical protein